jgi:Transposase DDE domain
MAMADRFGLPLAACAASASPHEVTLVAPTLDSRFVDDLPERLIGDRAYDADPLDEALLELGVEMIAPHRRNRTRPKTQDGRPLRRYKRRWKVEIVHPQMTKPDGGTVAGGGEDVADLDVAVGDNDAINQEFDERSSLVEGRRMQTHPHLRTEVLQRLGDCAEGDLLLCHGIELPLLVLQRLLPPRELAVLLFKGWQGEDVGELGIEQAVLGRVQLGHGMVQGGLPSLELLGQPLPAMGPS